MQPLRPEFCGPCCRLLRRARHSATWLLLLCADASGRDQARSLHAGGMSRMGNPAMAAQAFPFGYMAAPPMPFGAPSGYVAVCMNGCLVICASAVEGGPTRSHAWTMTQLCVLGVMCRPRILPGTARPLAMACPLAGQEGAPWVVEVASWPAVVSMPEPVRRVGLVLALPQAPQGPGLVRYVDPHAPS